MNSSKIKVSIVVPVYNVEPFIVQCFNSLINQTLKEIEIILINDFSTDRSGKICDEFAKNDSRITVIHNEKNLKQGISRNKGIEIAKGEYIGFIDPDDWVDIDYYEKLYETAIQNSSDIVKTERIKILPDGNQETQKKQNREILHGLKNKKPLFLLFNYEHTTAIFRTELIIKNKVLYPSIRNSQDVVFLLNATYFLKSISIISKTYYYYRQHPNSTISVKEKPYFESILEYFKLCITFINTHEMAKDHYDLVFSRGFYSIKNRFKEIDDIPDLKNYKREYVKKTLDLLLLYKHDIEYILDSFVLETSKLERIMTNMAKRVKLVVYKGGKLIKRN